MAPISLLSPSTRPETIIEIGSNTCKTTLMIAKKFPNSRVIGIESDSSLFEFSRGSHCKEQKNMLFILANIGQTSFWSQVQAQASDLKEGSVDLIISTHTLRMTDPNFDIALDHIFKMLKPGWFLSIDHSVFLTSAYFLVH